MLFGVVSRVGLGMGVLHFGGDRRRVVICLECGANDLHMVQLMPLPPHHLLLQ